MNAHATTGMLRNSDATARTIRGNGPPTPTEREPSTALIYARTAAVQLEAIEARIVEPKAGRMVPSFWREAKEGTNCVAIHANPPGTSRIACAKSKPTYVPDSAPSATNTSATATTAIVRRRKNEPSYWPRGTARRARKPANRPAGRKTRSVMRPPPRCVLRRYRRCARWWRRPARPESRRTRACRRPAR